VEKTSIRLNKYLSNIGFDARRKISDFLASNEVRINGKKVTEPGVRLIPGVDQVSVNGKVLSQSQKLVYFLINKPKGVISSVNDEHGRQTVVDLISTKERIYPVGRLDAETTGALILTNDGDLTNYLTHPKYHIDKTYLCLVPSRLSQNQKSQLEKGIDLKDGMTSPAIVEVIDEKPNRTSFKITIHEGRNHQVRRMLAKVKLELLDLKRLSIGDLELGELPIGQYRTLTASEIEALKQNQTK
jgi:23S rRNA pseudouridine2605 synthase